MSEPRPPLARDTLASLLATAGLAPSPAELDALLPPTAAIYAAIDRLDALNLQETEPAAVFHLPTE